MSARHRARFVCALVVGCAALAVAAAAAADGAFPDSMQMLLPSDRPHEAILATNFGLLITEDDGASWRWVCEQAIGPYARLYQLGQPPGDALYCIDSVGLHESHDGACTWTTAQGTLASTPATDVFPDPTDATHVLALANPLTDGSTPLSGLFESKDGGVTFGAPLYSAAMGTEFTGVEIAKSAPSTVYLTAFTYQQQPGYASVLKSTNGGATFLATNQSAVLGAQEARLAAIDPADSNKVYLRVVNPTGDSLAITSDGGATLRIALQLGDAMSAFLIRSDGAIIVGTRKAGAFISTDAGLTFTPWPNAPHLRGLGERGGTLWAAGDNFVDKFAVATSTDGGAHWTPLLRFDQIAGPLDCPNIQAVCAGPWTQLMAQFGIGAGSDGGQLVDAGTQPTHSKGCGCAIGEKSSTPRGSVFAAILFALGLTRRRRARPRSARVAAAQPRRS